MKDVNNLNVSGEVFEKISFIVLAHVTECTLERDEGRKNNIFIQKYSFFTVER